MMDVDAKPDDGAMEIADLRAMAERALLPSQRARDDIAHGTCARCGESCDTCGDAPAACSWASGDICEECYGDEHDALAEAVLLLCDREEAGEGPVADSRQSLVELAEDVKQFAVALGACPVSLPIVPMLMAAATDAPVRMTPRGYRAIGAVYGVVYGLGEAAARSTVLAALRTLSDNLRASLESDAPVSCAPEVS